MRGAIARASAPTNFVLTSSSASGELFSPCACMLVSAARSFSTESTMPSDHMSRFVDW